MGISSDAILCYGFKIVDEDGYYCENYISFINGDYNNNYERNIETFLALKHGLEFDENLEFMDYEKANELAKNCPIEIIYHGHSNCSYYILGIKESVITAYRGCPEEITIPSEECLKNWRNIIKEFCDKYEIEFKEPSLLLCSYSDF